MKIYYNTLLRLNSISNFKLICSSVLEEVQVYLYLGDTRNIQAVFPYGYQIYMIF